MQRFSQILILAICSIALFGCPYESQVPISKPSIPVDKRFLGTWLCNEESYNKYVISQSSNTEYRILQESTVGIKKFTGFVSELKGNLFLNVRNDSTGTYYLYKLTTDPSANKFTLIPLSEKISEHFGSIEGMKSYVEKNMTFKDFYNNADKSEFNKVEGLSSASN